MSAAAVTSITTAPPPALELVENEHPAYAPCAAEVAECTCPEFCERDHELD
jgi:hypothetical protein